MKRPCYCGRALKDVPLDKFDGAVPPHQKQCVFCWNALNDPEYQRLWRIHPEELRPLTRAEIKALPKSDKPCGAC